jgi:uncharacterized membrane protein
MTMRKLNVIFIIILIAIIVSACAFVFSGYHYLKYSPEAQYQGTTADIVFYFFIPFAAAAILVIIIWLIAATIHKRKLRKNSTKTIDI